MQRSILAVIIIASVTTTAYAQTATGTTDPLSVPTSSLPSTSSFSSGSSASTVEGSTAATGTAVGSTGGVGASFSRSSQAPLELPGEGLDSSTRSPSTTAAAPAAPSTICPPSIPTTDGGSANITAIDGFSPSGC